MEIRTTTTIALPATLTPDDLLHALARFAGELGPVVGEDVTTGHLAIVLTIDADDLVSAASAAFGRIREAAGAIQLKHMIKIEAERILSAVA